MQIYSTKNYNISSKGYYKNLKNLKFHNNLAKFNYYVLPNVENKKILYESNIKLDNFLNKNKLMTLFSNFILILTYINDYIKGIEDSKEENLAKKSYKKIERKLIDKYENEKINFENKDYTYNQLLTLLNNEKNTEKINLIKSKINLFLKSIENDFKDLIKSRNEYAKLKGYNNFYEYQLKVKYGVDDLYIQSLINNIYKDGEGEIVSILKERKNILAKYFNIEPQELKPEHQIKLANLLDLNKYITKPEQIYEIVKRTYNSMGFNIDKLENNEQIYYDLYEKEGKISNSFCKPIIIGEKVGISINNLSSFNSIKILMHEMGHAVYILNSSKLLPITKKTPQTNVTEAVSIMMDILIEKENFIDDIIPDSVYKYYKEMVKYDAAYKLSSTVGNVIFEREIYKNPDQDFSELRNNIAKIFSLTNDNKNFIWLIKHYIDNPIYYQNYLRGNILSEKIYSSIKETLGTDLSKNPKTAQILIKKLFRYGGYISEKKASKIFEVKKF